MKVIPISNGRRQNITTQQNKVMSNPIMPKYKQNNELSNVYYLPVNTPTFKGLRFETNVIQKVLGKQYQGLGIYTPDKNFIDFAKIGIEKLAKEPLNIVTATAAEIAAYRFSMALSESYSEGSEFGTQWTTRYNPENRRSPLAVSHTLSSENAKEQFAKNLEFLYNERFGKSLDIPITDKDGNLTLNAVVFDTETTGTNPKADKIVQIATSQIRNGKIVENEHVNQLINPEIPIPLEASSVNGITDDMVKDSPTIQEYITTFLDKTLNKENGVIVAYNSKFDVPLLNKEIRDFNTTAKDSNTLKEKQMAKVLDPFILIQRIHPFLGAKKKLGQQYQWLFCKEMENAHDALADVNGTVDVLKYCLYYLSEHRKDKSVPLTLREVLIFQNGGHGVENIDIPLNPNKNFNANFKFDQSYKLEPLDVTNYFQGYKLSEKVIKDIIPEIGEENAKKLLGEGFVNEEVTANSKGHAILAGETQKTENKKSFKSLSYILQDNMKKVLEFANLEGYNGKSKEEIEDFIIEKSKKYANEKIKNIWIKNVNPKDIAKGNDLPDDNITKRVMSESLNVV